MHYVCFHYEFEHDPVDPDEACEGSGCPSEALADSREQVISNRPRVGACGAQGASWENNTLDRYIEALAAWLSDSEGYYLTQGRIHPSNAWEATNDAFQAATVYE